MGVLEGDERPGPAPTAMGSRRVGWGSSITVGDDGLRLVNRDTATDDLKVAHCSNVACSSATAATLEADGDVGRAPSITIRTDGLGLVAYLDYSNWSLTVAHLANVLGLPFVRRR